MWTRIALLAQEAADLPTTGGWFDGIDADQKFVLTIIALGCLTVILITVGGVVAGVWSSAHRRRMEVDLKREMLDRGMTAEEVAKVIEAVPPPEDGLGRWLANCSKKR
ncbi:MAG: hypothetical protein KDA44_22860 [Planctomycetales bacterium]|nr:hypothetical protein [Planctomycetales bacterium]